MEKLNIFKGVFPNPEEDPRNYNISQFVPNQDKITNTEFMLKLPTLDIIIDQEDFQACVGHSYAVAKSILEYQQSNKWIDFDPFMIYGTRYQGEYSGVGMYPNQGAKVLYKDGAFLRRDFNRRLEMPLLKSEVEEWKGKHQDKVIAAKDYRISGYAFLNRDNDIKKALKAGMPVSCMYPMFPSFYETGSDGKVPNRKSGEVEDGYHQMLIVGWTYDNWIVVNSWGKQYGLKGMYLIPFSYPRESAISVSDKIIPSLRKASKIEFTIGSTSYKVNDNIMEMDTAPYIKNERTYLPIRYVTESLGCSVEWNDNTKTALIHSEEADIQLTIGSDLLVVNGSPKYHMDVCPEIVNERTMVPVRFVSEFLNCKVDWNQEKQLVTITAL